MGNYRRYSTRRYFFNTRATPFLSRLPITRIQRGLALEYVKQGTLRPWFYTKEQMLGNGVALHLDYQPRPVRLIGTVMDVYGHETSLKGGLKIISKHEETNVALWVPLANPKIRHEVTGAANSFQHFLDERDKWDEAWMTGRARLK